MNRDRLRTLLDAYYDGSATTAQVDELKRYFSSATVGDVPQEFAPDAAVFRALARMADAHAVPPVGMEARILAATVGKPRRKFLLLRRWAAVAASVAALIAVAVFLLPRPEMPQEADVLIAGGGEEIRTGLSVVDTLSMAAANDLAADTVRVGKARVVTPRQIAARQTVELTDSAAAVDATFRVLARLRRTLGKTADGVEHAEMAAAIIKNPMSNNKEN